MALVRPETFEGIYGQSHIVRYLQERLRRGNVPQYLLFLGEEGLGKTTIVKLLAKALSCKGIDKPCGTCTSCKEIDDKVIRQNIDTSNVLTFKMSLDGSKDAVHDVIANLNTSFLTKGTPKIIILEECHGMLESAQNALLSDLEYLPENVYVFMATTSTAVMSKALLSRFFTLYFNRVPKAEMLRLLTNEVRRRNISLHGGNATLSLISEWAENKPRKALNLLEGFGNNSEITMPMIKDYIGFVDVRAVTPILRSLGESGAITTGIYHIFELEYGPGTTSSLVTIFTEAVRIAHGELSFKLSSEDYSEIKEAVIDTDPKVLTEMLYHVCAVHEVTAPYLVASYLKSHPKGMNVEKAEPSKTLSDEMRFRQDTMKAAPEGAPEPKVARPTMAGLLANSKRIEK